MKILLVNTSERTGGAAIATHRLMRALNNNGVQARMLVRDKDSDSPHVLRLPTSRLMQRAKFVAERGEIYAANRFSRENLWTVDLATHGTDITCLPAFREADVIHLNWINQGMLSLWDISKILRTGKKVVWTLHDMWPCTGICHHAESCEGWKTACGQCPRLKAPSAGDLSARIFRRKQKTYANGRITFVACSNWLADIARQAPLLRGCQVESIPNAIDTQFYQPGDKQAARQRLGLPADRKLMLFVAYKATDPKKGIDYLIEATELMAREHPDWIQKLGIVPVGLEADTLRNRFACDAYPMDYVSDPTVMRDLYRAADLLVMPTLMDNLPNTIVEGMACGLPCVGFNIGGLPQMVQNGLNGFLARYRDAADFARLSLETLYGSNYALLSETAQRTARATYSEQVVAAKYIRLYESL